jgi:hypothetical protein
VGVFRVGEVEECGEKNTWKKKKAQLITEENKARLTGQV